MASENLLELLREFELEVGSDCHRVQVAVNRSVKARAIVALANEQTTRWWSLRHPQAIFRALGRFLTERKPYLVAGVEDAIKCGWGLLCLELNRSNAVRLIPTDQQLPLPDIIGDLPGWARWATQTAANLEQLG